MDLSILIVSYNTRQLTLACLESVFQQTSGIEFEVIVADNASADGSADAIAQQFPAVRLIRLEKNLGFAGANNLAAKQATGQFILLLNPDTVILDGAIQKALAFQRVSGGEGIVGGRTFLGDRSLNYNSCHGRPTPWSMFCMASGLSSMFRRSALFAPEALGSWKRDTPRQVDAVSGCFLLIGRQLWQQLEGFDESFFMYGEDTDLCLRAWKLGRTCQICPQATLVHYGAASDNIRPDKLIRLFRAKVQLFDKHWSKGRVPFGIAMFKLAAFTRMLSTGALQWIRPKLRPKYQTWREVWRRRSEFAQRNGTSTTSRGPGDQPHKRILAVASGGGHWVQLCRLMPAFQGHEVIYVTTMASNRQQVGPATFYFIRDASRWNKLGLIRMALQVLWLLLRHRPDVVITTGAAVGYFCIRFGKRLGARTIWLDSIANVEELSMSGRHAGKHADLWLTQWPHLAQPQGPHYMGAVL